ncbi:hypothetical protein ABUW04_19910 [Streptacidiphilus sp. N1-10]|uniref:Transporter n=1 Tax=Streptacidiphilus jeojiensis TaxID=3229225 RepID=A0ABV6XQJ2_9ACTN
MIRLAWLQFRVQAAVGFGALAVLAGVLAVTGRHDDSLRLWLGVLMMVVPGLVGAFWGAPLVASEAAAGTLPLAWTQSVSRRRWLGVRIGVTALAAMTATGLLSLLVTWWASPLDRADRSVFATFDQRGVVPIGYAAFALALGITVGALVRRTLPAMATTAVVLLAARAAFANLVRPHLGTPITRDFVLTPAATGYGSQGSLLSVLFSSGRSTLEATPPTVPDAWTTSIRIVDRSGRGLTDQVLRADCPDIGQGGSGAGGGSGGGFSHSQVPASVAQAYDACVTKVAATYHGLTTYQPGSRYWEFQWYELTAFLCAALLLVALCLWLIRRTPGR